MNYKNVSSTLLLASAVACAFPAASAEYTLRFSHFFPAVSAPQKELFQAWADSVESDSKGRIKVDIYPSSTLAKPPAQYDAVANRIADVTATIQGYTANRFPLTQIVELPGIAKSAASGSCIVQKLYEDGTIASEYKKTHPLFFFTHGLGHIHTTKKLIEKPEDLSGLRIRRPTSVVANLLEGLGAQPVGMPAPDAYESAQRGVIDGVTLPWEGELVFRLNELTPYHTEVGGLYTLAFVMTMNKDVYNSMPKDLQQVIDKNSGLEWSEKAAKVFDTLDAKGRQQAIDKGHTITVIEGGINNPAWKPVLDKATKQYLSELKSKGLPAYQVYDQAVKYSETCL
jgi:TRAP-type transport system periplasmic protein